MWLSVGEICDHEDIHDIGLFHPLLLKIVRFDHSSRLASALAQATASSSRRCVSPLSADLTET